MTSPVNSPASKPPARRATVVEGALAGRQSVRREPGTYALFMSKGFLGTETEARPVTSREVRRLTVPATAFGFCFVDVESAFGEWVRPSQMYYVDGDVIPRESLHLFFGGSRARQIVDSFPGVERFFNARTEGLFPMEPDDVALPVERVVSL